MNVTYTKAPHAALFKRYVDGEFVEVGEDGKHGPVDPETGAEYKALGRGGEHKYLRDYKVGSSYPSNVFVVPSRDTSVTHSDLEGVLRENDLWSESLSRVLVPAPEGEWLSGFMYRPIEDAPDLDTVEQRLEDATADDYPVYSLGHAVEASLEA